MEPIDLVGLGHPEADPRALLYFEWRQRRESGYLVDDFAEDVYELGYAPLPHPAACLRLLNRIEAAPPDQEWRYDEVGQVPAASVTLPRAAEPPPHLYDRILGGWLGRCVGCTAGRPLANGSVWPPARIRSYLERVDAYPLSDYVPVRSPMPEGYELHSGWPESTRGRVDGCPRVDDLDFTVLGLNLLERHGATFTAAEVAAEWLERLPFLRTHGAERVAYRNLIDGHEPPLTAELRNPYREWIGALIRADIYGYAHPGDPARAADLAGRDATVSHTGNGIWAARWAAALISAAFTAGDPASALAVARQVIPENSRLASALAHVTDSYRDGLDWERAVAAVHARHGHYSWVHAIGNVSLIAAALLWGAGDFTTTIALAVQGGWATDSTAATAGSVAGVLCGATALPEHWTAPLHDRLRTSVAGHDEVGISVLARRTFDLAREHVSSR